MRADAVEAVPDAFLAALDALPEGHSEGLHGGRRYGVTRTTSADGRRRWLYAEERGGTDRVSCNLYRLPGGRAALRPCEMPAAKVIGFVLGFRPTEPGMGPGEEPGPEPA